MREILFRGKTEKNDWVYGTPIFYMSGECSTCPMLERYGSEATDIYKRDKVDPATVGQFTGLQDANKKDIYEGDIVMVTNPSGKRVKKVIKCNNELWETIGVINKKIHEHCISTMHTISHMNFEIIGNIHDNPELLK